MEEKKNNAALIIVISIILMIVVGGVFWNLGVKFADHEFKKNQNNTNNTIDNIDNNETANKENIEAEENQITDNIKSVTLNGTYELVKDTYKGDKGDDGYVNASYTFNDNGLFYFVDSTFAEYGYYGNYIVDGNVIKLNYLFSHGSGLSLDVMEDAGITINIVDNKTIKQNDGTTFIKENNTKNIKSYLFENYKSVIEDLINNA